MSEVFFLYEAPYDWLNYHYTMSQDLETTQKFKVPKFVLNDYYYDIGHIPE